MHTILGVVVVAMLAFVGTMIDNFFAFAAQLLVTTPDRHRRVSWAQALGVGSMVALAGGLGSLLTPIPVRWIGALAVAPFWFAWHTWRTRAALRQQFRRGALTTFVMTFALGGDNLAVWIPLLRANGFTHALVTIATFAILEVVFLLSAQRLAAHPRVVAWGNEHAATFMPFVYALLGVLVLFECHTI
ncbi:MAG TPA: cadmium resistance transporter [Acidimicrobiales bacterium]|nr:cadmium resistance transporter [Acidimicrobiales bacterium]